MLFRLDSIKNIITLPDTMKFLSINISVLILSFLLSLPGLVFADHAHGTTTEEINCELCSHIGAALPDEKTSVVFKIPKQQKIEGKASFAPLKTRRLRPPQRAPPPLR